MKFTKTVDSKRVKLVRVKQDVISPFGRPNPVVYERWEFCKDGQHYVLFFKSNVSNDSPSFHKFEMCDGQCKHQDVAIPEFVLDRMYLIFGNKRKIISDWDVARHNRIIRRMNKSA